MPIKFPPVHTATPEGLLAVGGKLNTETLITAYKQGIFPWPISKDSPLTWFSPDPRGIIEFDQLHIPRSFLRFLKNNSYTVRYNSCFEQVIHSCSSIKRKHEKGTWISQDIIDGYIELFEQGHAYSVEVFEKDNLIGGLYGVCLGEIISGESMFHLKTNASKLALYSLIHQLQSKGLKWLDTQMVTPVIKNFGGRQISRVDYIEKLEKLNPQLPTRYQLFSP